MARYPCGRHNGGEFDMGRDLERRELAGSDMEFAAAVIYIKSGLGRARLDLLLRQLE